MKKNYKPESVIKTILYQKEDNSVELYSLSRGQIVETYLRRGDSVELVEGEVDLRWKPEKATYGLYPDTNILNSWSQQNGIQSKQILKHFQK